MPLHTDKVWCRSADAWGRTATQLDSIRRSANSDRNSHDEKLFVLKGKPRRISKGIKKREWTYLKRRSRWRNWSPRGDDYDEVSREGGEHGDDDTSDHIVCQQTAQPPPTGSKATQYGNEASSWAFVCELNGDLQCETMSLYIHQSELSTMLFHTHNSLASAGSGDTW